MNVVPLVQLQEVDLELSLIGTLLMSPGAFAMVADDIQPEWFSEPTCRYVFEAAHDVHSSGSRLSTAAIVAMLPEQVVEMPRGEFIDRVLAAAAAANAIPGMMDLLRDRWARRRLNEVADTIRAGVRGFGASPYEMAAGAIVNLDAVNAAKSRKTMGTLDDGVAALKEATADLKSARGATTGLMSLDNKLNGYKAGQLYVVGGRPGMGKSAFMCSSLRRTAQMSKGVAIFSLEMTEEEIAARCLADAADDVKMPGFGDIARGLVSPGERDALDVVADSMAGLPFLVDASPRMTFSEIAGRARKAKHAFEAQGVPLSVVCIDHMGLVTPSDRYRGNKVAEASEVSGAARALAKELNCCVLLLCQLSREVERRDDKRPTLADLRWSGEIEQDAHVVAFLYRPAYYLAQDPAAEPWQINDVKNKLEFLIRKNRNGDTADISLWCSIAHSMVRDDL